MKKYLKPELEVTNILAQEMMIAMSGEGADKDYPGGGDAKADIFGSDDDNDIFDF